MTTFTLKEKVDRIMEFFDLPKDFTAKLTNAIRLRKSIGSSSFQKVVVLVDYSTVTVLTDDKQLSFCMGEMLITEEQENFLRYLNVDIEQRSRESMIKKTTIPNLFILTSVQESRSSTIHLQLFMTSVDGQRLFVPIDEDKSVEDIIDAILSSKPTSEIIARIDEYRERHLSAQALEAIVDDYADEEQLEVQKALDRLVLNGNTVALALRNILDEDEVRAFRGSKGYH